MNKNRHTIRIETVTNGHIVQVGCQTFVDPDTDHMLAELGRYLKNPKEVAMEYGRKYNIPMVPEPCLNTPEAPYPVSGITRVQNWGNTTGPSEACEDAPTPSR